MPNVSDRSPVELVDAAIAEVLLAEGDARAAVAQYVVDAEGLVEKAKQDARDIARRAAQRAVRIQQWSAGRLQQQLAELRSQQVPTHGAETETPQRLQQIVAELAATLTGGGHAR